MTYDLKQQLRDLANCRHDDLSIGREAADRIEELEQLIASRDAEVKELLAALQMAFDYAIIGKKFPDNAQTTALLNAVEIELAKVRKP